MPVASWRLQKVSVTHKTKNGARYPSTPDMEATPLLLSKKETTRLRPPLLERDVPKWEALMFSVYLP
jgi:hypothetical protein